MRYILGSMRSVYLLPFLAAVLWSWSFVATKVLLRYLSVVEIIAVRLLLAVPAMLVLVLARGLFPRLERRDARALLGGAAILLVHFLIQFTGLRTATATNAGWLIAAAPIPIAILARVFLRERIGPIQIAGMGIATAGILLLVSGGDWRGLSGVSHAGDWLVLASSVTWAAFTVATRDLSRRHPPLAVTALMLAVCAAAVVALALLAPERRASFAVPLEGILAALFLGFFCTFLAFWFWQEAVARLGAARTGFFLYFMPVSTMALAVPYLGESFGWVGASGGALVLAGVALAERRPKAAA